MEAMKQSTNSVLTGAKAVTFVVAIWAVAYPSMLWALHQVLG